MCNDKMNCDKCFCDDLNKPKCIPFEQRIVVNDLARAFVPFQKYCSIFEPCEAFIAGTIFPELYKPEQYLKKGGC